MQNGEGIRFQQPRFSLMPTPSWGLQSPFVIDINIPLQKNPNGKNCVLEAFCKHQYWEDKDGHLCSDFDWPVFQVAANPSIMTGANNLLINENTPDGYSDYKQERPSCTSINKPNRFADPTFDIFPAFLDTTIIEPDALCIRFGYTDQQAVWGANADHDYYSDLGRTCSERGISFRVP